MIEIDISKDQIKRAKELYDFQNLRGSVTKGKGQIYGAMGEIIVNDYYGSDRVVFESTYDYDMLIDGYKVDVKTKHANFTPQPSWVCSLPSYNTKQKCDYYIFCTVKKSMDKAWILGAISKQSFFERSEFAKRGTPDKDGFKFRCDCYNLEVNQLNQIK